MSIPSSPVTGLPLLFSNEWLRDKIASDPDVELATSVVAQSQDGMRMLANLFSESSHETWTKDEIVNIIKDAIKLSAQSPSGNTEATNDAATINNRLSDSGNAGAVEAWQPICPVCRGEGFGKVHAGWGHYVEVPCGYCAPSPAALDPVTVEALRAWFKFQSASNTSRLYNAAAKLFGSTFDPTEYDDVE